MKNYTLRSMLWGLAVLPLLAGFYSCEKENKIKEPAVTVNPAADLQAYPGLHRAKLQWTVKDPSVKKAVAYCDNGDSVVVPYEGAEEMSALFTGLTGGNYSFKVYLYDAEGHASSRAKVVIRVYGDRYIQSLSSRKINDALFQDGDVIILWGDPEGNALSTEARYVDVNGDTQTVQVERSVDTTVLEQYKAGSFFQYRSLYKPVPEALDTFYAAYASAEKLSTFINPLFQNKGADPWAVYKDGTYYFTYTTGGSVVLYATEEMSELGNAEPVKVWDPPSGTDHSSEIWAPELHFINGKWYIYVAADDGHDVNHRMFVLENASPDPLQGTWEFKGELKEPADEWAIDGTILQYNGQLYMIWSGKTGGTFPQNIYIAPMSNPYTLAGSRVMISTPEYAWEKNGAAINEGPAVLKNSQDDVFVVYSGSGFWTDDYCLGMLRLKPGGDPMNPADWTKTPTPVLKKSEAASAYGPGHCSFFPSRDGTEQWVLYHARTYPNGGSTNHRNPRMQKINWNADGTPDFGVPVKVGESVRTPSGEF